MSQRVPSDSYLTLADVVRSFAHRKNEKALGFFDGFRIRNYTYQELYDLSLRCYAFFHEKSLSKGDRILIWSPNRPEWGVVLCACALSGIILVPLDARNTPEFVQRIAKETGAKMIFRSRHRRDPGLSIPSVMMESFLDVLGLIDPIDSLESIQPEDTLEILYTSGTTGQPKGVVLSHQNVACNLNDILTIIPIDPTYRLLSVLPLSHALEQTAGFWTPLAGGGSVLYLHALKPSALFEAFQRDSITAMILVPRLLTLLKQRIESKLQEGHLSFYLHVGLSLSRWFPVAVRKIYFYPIHKRFNTKFHLFVAGGAPLARDTESFWKALGFELLQGYGLTETSPVLTVTRPGQPRMGSVGRSLDNVELRLDADQEILAQGANVFSGYYNNPQATADVFVKGWFKTGDVGEIDSDGFLYLRSRKKDIIVTSDGINIYPEDIESLLDNQPGVKESCVIGVGDHEEEIHAVLIFEDEEGDASSIIARVNSRLSPEQRIASWSLWPQVEFPKTPTLKIKKNEVKKGIQNHVSEQQTSASVPEKPLYFLLNEMIGSKEIIFQPDMTLGHDLGLSSIERVELITRLEDEFRLDIDDQAVTPDTTIGELETTLEKRMSRVSTIPFRRWTRSTLCQGIRILFQQSVIRFLLRLFCRIDAKGHESIQDLQGPVFIVANHTSHVDTPLILSLLPGRVGKRVCPAAWKEYFDTHGASLPVKIGKWIAWQVATVGFNIFPFSQNTAYRRSMAYAGELVDDGWSILYFPEGARSENGEWKEFYEGVGILAQNLRIPILPVAIKGGEKVLPRGKGIPRRDQVHIRFGKPFRVPSTSYKQITRKIRDEIMTLWKQMD